MAAYFQYRRRKTKTLASSTPLSPTPLSSSPLRNQACGPSEMVVKVLHGSDQVRRDVHGASFRVGSS